MGGECTDARVAAASAVIARALLPASRRVDDEWVLLAVGAADDNVVGLSRLLAGLLLRIGHARSEPLVGVAGRVGEVIGARVATGPYGFTAAACADARLLVGRLGETLAASRMVWDPAGEFGGPAPVPVGRVTKALGIAGLGAVIALAEATGDSVSRTAHALIAEPPTPTTRVPAPAAPAIELRPLGLTVG